MELLFVTRNPNKAREIGDMAGNDFRIKTLDSIGFDKEIPENEPTLEGNASVKSWHIYDLTGKNCFADDTGLEIEALDGKPGVHSARYGGDEKNDSANIEKVLSELSGKTNRNAIFRTVISLIINGKETLFEGTAEGKIIDKQRGSEGFGYDPIFVPKGYDKTFAEMSLSEKNRISHRYLAIKKLVEYLKAQVK